MAEQNEVVKMAGEQSELLGKLESIEELLRLQTAQGKKQSRTRTAIAALMVALVLVFGVGMFALNQTVSHATQDLPELIDSTNQSMEQLEITLENISDIDFDALNETMGAVENGLGSVDFEALNSSIQDLQKIVEGMRKFVDIFG